MRRLRKYLALTPGGRALVLRSLLLLPAVAMLLRARGMGRATAFLRRIERRARHDPEALAPREAARLVDAAASVLRLSCLPRALVLCHHLRSRGMAAEIRLGVSRPGDGDFSAHAWVELDRLPLNGSTDVLERYAVLPASGNMFVGVDRR